MSSCAWRGSYTACSIECFSVWITHPEALLRLCHEFCSKAATSQWGAVGCTPLLRKKYLTLEMVLLKHHLDLPIPPRYWHRATMTRVAPAITREPGLSPKPVLQHLGLILTPQLHMGVSDLLLSPGEWILNAIIVFGWFLPVHTDRKENSEINWYIESRNHRMTRVGKDLTES